MLTETILVKRKNHHNETSKQDYKTKFGFEI